MTVQLSETQKSELQGLIGQAIAAGSTTSGAWSPVYARLFNDLTQSTTLQDGSVSFSPIEGVDHNVWMWIFGAQSVNAGTGPFGDLIRQYTKIQYQLRTGGQLTDSDIDKASNDIAAKFMADVLSNGVPDIQVTGLHDAGEIASSLFGGNFSPWAGTLLFANLGYDQFFRDSVLNVGTSSQKQESGTYDLIAAAQAIQDFNPSLLSAIRDLPETIFTLSELGRYSSTLTSITNDTNAFFKQVYGLTDSNTNVRIGSDTFGIWSTLTNATKTAHYAVGTTGDDSIGAFASINGSYVTDGSDVVNTGRGNDTITGTTGSDIIDGGEGFDTLDYSHLSENGRVLTIDNEGAFGWRGIVGIGDANSESFESRQYVFNIENIKLTSQDDKFILSQNPGVVSSLTVDGGDDNRGEDEDVIGDTIDFSHFGSGVRVTTETGSSDAYSIIEGKNIKFKNFETIIGSNQSDSLQFGDGNQTISGGDGDDTIEGGAGENTLTGGRGADRFIVGLGDDIIMDADSDDRLYIRLSTINESAVEAADKLIPINGGFFLRNTGSPERGASFDNYLGFATLYPVTTAGEYLDDAPIYEDLTGEFAILFFKSQPDILAVLIYDRVDFVEGSVAGCLAHSEPIASVVIMDFHDGDFGFTFQEIISPFETDGVEHFYFDNIGAYAAAHERLLNGGRFESIPLNSHAHGSALQSSTSNVVQSFSSQAGLAASPVPEVNHSLAGTAANDTFVFHANFGQATISDFTAGAGIGDVIEFHDNIFADFAAIQAASHQIGNDVQIAVGASNSILLKNVALNNLHMDDFQFV